MSHPQNHDEKEGEAKTMENLTGGWKNIGEKKRPESVLPKWSETYTVCHRNRKGAEENNGAEQKV